MDSKEYIDKNDLAKAFVNDGITCAHTHNVVVYGNTLYLDAGRYFHQISIRLSDNIFICNKRDSSGLPARYITDHIIKNLTAMYYVLDLPTLTHKLKCGYIRKKILDEILNPQVPRYVPSRITVAAKKYLTDSPQDKEIYHIMQLIFLYNKLKDNNGTVVQKITYLSNAVETCAKIDPYLDILIQMPELKP